MRRSAFTIIELIFVIFISGILAAVVFPRLADLSRDAKRTKVIAFVGTLNRMVGPSMWGKAILTHDGKVASSGANLCINIDDYIDLPSGVTDFSAACRLTIDADLGVPIINTFTEGTSIEAPKWKVKF